MRNRTPRRPGRVRIVPENGTAAFYARVEMADEPSDVGTTFSVNTILKDRTAAELGFADPASTVPDDIFHALANAIVLREGGYKTMSGSDASPVFVKNFRGTGSYPVKYGNLPFVPRFALVRGWAANGETAVSIVYPGSGGTVTQVGSSGLVQNFKMSIDGAGITITADPGGKISGAHNVNGKYESVIAFR